MKNITASTASKLNESLRDRVNVIRIEKFQSFYQKSVHLAQMLFIKAIFEVKKNETYKNTLD